MQAAHLGPDAIPAAGVGVARLLMQAWTDGEAIRTRLKALATAAPALDLRLARLLAWLRVRDLAPLGYAGWIAFTREHVDWGEAWIRSLVRLVRSGLGAVLRAACEGRIPLTVAVVAPSTCAADAQDAWIAACQAGFVPDVGRRPSGSFSTIEPDEADALVIWHARHRVRLLEGLPLADREADDRLLAWWRGHRPPEEIVSAALAPAPAPAVAPGDYAPDWEFADPADLLLGPWRTPANLDDAMLLLHQVQTARRSRALDLGRLYERVVREGLHRMWGFRDVESFCEATMGRTARSLQRHRELARVLRRRPALREAAEAGMSLARVEAVGRIADEYDVERWVAVAARTPVVEIRQASAHVEMGVDAEVLLDAYEATMAASATGTVALASIQVPVPPRLTDRVHPDLPEAARWLLAIPLPAQRGFGRVKERDHFIDANPECRRRALRNHAHHVLFRQHGGDDTPENGVCVCPGCHLRLIHANHVSVTKVGDALVWSYPGRTVTVVPGPEIWPT